MTAPRPPDTDLPFLRGYAEPLLAQVRGLIDTGRLGDYLAKRYPNRHQIQSDKALHAYVDDLRQRYLRRSQRPDRVCYDSKLDVLHNALGLNTRQARVHGGRLQTRREIRIASLFRDTAPEFLDMIVVHELAHLRELEHNKAFYQLCEHMLPGYGQLEFDLRLWLTWQALSPDT